MITSEAKTEKTIRTIAPIASDEADKMRIFSEILRKREEKNERTVVTILRRIESNTSLLKKFGTAEPETHDRVTTARGTIPRNAPLSRANKGRHLTVKAKEERSQRAGKERKEPSKGALDSARDENSMIGKAASDKVRSQKTGTMEPSVITAKRVKQEEAVGGVIPEVQSEAKSVDQRPSSVMPPEPERDTNGRFVGKSKSQEARAEQGNKIGKKSILQTLKRGMEGINDKGRATLATHAGTLEEAAGRAAGGPIFDAVMELKGALDSARDENSMIGKAARWVGKKTRVMKKDQVPRDNDHADQGRFLGAKEEGDKIVETLNQSEDEDGKRHEELIKAILRNSKSGNGGNTAKGPGNPDSTGLPYPKKTGPGSKVREKLKQTLRRKLSPTIQKVPGMPGSGGRSGGDMPGMPGFGLKELVKMTGPFLSAALPIAMPILVGAALLWGAKEGYGQLPEEEKTKRKDTTDHPGGPVVNAWKNEPVDPKTGKAISIGESVAQFVGRQESGAKKNYSAVNLNDTGGTVSAGKYQFNSKGQLPSFLGVRDKEGITNADKFGITADPKKDPQGFKGQWQAAASGENKAEFEKAQDIQFQSAVINPALTRAQAHGVDISDVGTQKIVASMATTTGAGGNTRILKRAVEAGGGYEAFKKLTPAQQQDLIVAERKNYVQNDVSTMTPKQKAEALERYDREKAEVRTGTTTSTVDKNAETKPVPTVATVAKEEKKQLLTAKGEPAIETATATPVAKPGSTALGQGAATTEATKPMAVATALPMAGPKGFMANAMNVADANQIVPEMPVTTLAKGAPARVVGPPERITTARAMTNEQPKQTQGPSQAGTDMSGTLMVALEKLNASVAKMSGNDETAQSGAPVIRTEFDDTMLTLMAYDRV